MLEGVLLKPQRLVTPLLIFVVLWDSLPSLHRQYHAVVLFSGKQSETTNINGEWNFPVPPLWVPRHLYASGFDARTDVANLQYPRAIWVWTDNTVKFFQRELEQHVTNKSLCKSNTTEWTMELRWGGWGLFSEVRDAGDMLLGSLVTASPMFVQDQDHPCDKEHENAPPYLFCYFEPLTVCRKGDKAEGPKHAYLDRYPYIWDGRSESFWDILQKNDLRATRLPLPGDCPLRADKFSKCLDIRRSFPHDYLMPSHIMEDWKRNLCESKAEALQKHLIHSQGSVLRALLFASSFKLVPDVKKSLDEVRAQREHLPMPMLVVHIRRTDKKNDFAQLMKQESAATLDHTLFIIVRLIKAVERLSGKPFGSLFVISDDPRIASDKAAHDILSGAGANAPVVFVSEASNDKDAANLMLQGGHVALPHEVLKKMNRNLLLDILWAADQASYVVGNGRSGVSQAIAQLLGARFKMDPNFLGLWEDDTTTLECLQETRDIAWLVEP
mmetsp:Transcript_55386/g.121080  ORF Transcript_55386/g.121080 Transcript_55386/m.121080 type:complete len:498 (+) Transcript_55386:105-1598(+)